MSAPAIAADGWTVSSVPPEDVAAVWPLVVDDIRRVLRHGMGHTLSIDEIRRSILEERRILWVVHRGDTITSCLVLEFLRHPSGEVALRVVLIAGARFWEWAEQTQELLVDLATLSGATTLEAVVRPGLERWLRRLGWRRRAVLVELTVGGHHG